MSYTNYMFVVEVKDKKIAIKNKKYLRNIRAQRIMDTDSRYRFYNKPDLVTMQSYAVYDIVSKLPEKAKYLDSKSFTSLEKEFYNNIPIWILEYKEIWDLIKDNLYVQYLPTSMPMKADEEKINKYLDIKCNTKTSNIEAKLKKIFIRLSYSINNVLYDIENNKPLDVVFVSYEYKDFKYSYGYFGLGLNSDEYLFNDNYKKIMKPSPEIKNIVKYFNLYTKPESITNPVSINLQNLIKLMEKYQVKVVFGSKGDKVLAYLSAKKLVENIGSYSTGFLEKIMKAMENNNKYIEHNGDIILLDSKIEEKLDIIFENFLNTDLKTFLDSIKKCSQFKKVDQEIMKKIKELDFKAELFEHQELGVSWMYNLYKSGLTTGLVLADDMGLGKSITTIASLALIQNKNPNKKITIISPASMVGTWKSEIEKFYPDLKNYEIMSYEKALRSLSNTDILVLDEAQKIKNHMSEIYKSITSIKKEFTIVLTGTPIENKVDDIINILGVINPVFLKLKPLKKHHGQFEIRLREFIDPIFLQRKKTDIKNINLDSKLNEIPVMIQPTELEKKLLHNIRKIYHDRLIKLNASNNYDFYESQVILTGLIRIRQAISYPGQLPEDLLKHLPRKQQIAVQSMIPSKFKKLKETCKKIIDKKEKIVIFAEFTETINFLKRELGKEFKVVTFTGSDNSTRRKVIIDSFQNGIYDIIIISLKAGNSGITLHTSNNVIIYDLWYNPQVLAQAVARVHRIGQNKDVSAYFMVLKDTFDERIYNILYKKKELINNFENYNPNKIVKELGDDYFKEFKASYFK